MSKLLLASQYHASAALTTLKLQPVSSTNPLTRAKTDRDFVEIWLGRPSLSERTVRHCRKEAERFLLWCEAQGKHLCEVRLEDLLAYASFVAAPPEDWISSTRWPREDARWRAFCGPLSLTSQKQVLTIIKGMFRWAHAARYLSADPAALLGSMTIRQETTVSRFLPQAAIPFLLAAATNSRADWHGSALRHARDRFLVKAFYFTAVRLSELVNADMNNFAQDDDGAWWLHVVGKGGKPRKVPAPFELINDLSAYRQAYGLDPMPAVLEHMPLVLTSIGPARRTSTYGVAKIMKGVLLRAAQLAKDAGQACTAARIGKASTHWLRHTSLTHQINAGSALKTVQLNAGHTDIGTTGRYVHKEDGERHTETSSALEDMIGYARP